MNTTALNINRLGLLLKRYFVENKQRELTFWGIVTVVFTLMHLAGSTEKFISVEMFLFVSGFIFAARSFKFFNFTPSGMHYLMIPATHLEKVITAILLSIFYYFAMILLTYTVGTIMGTSIGNMFFGTNNPIQFLLFQSSHEHFAHGRIMYQSGFDLFENFLTFAGIQSTFLLGSIYFKGNAIGKTFLSIFGICIILLIIESFLFRIAFGTFHVDGRMMSISLLENSNTSKWFEVMGKTLKYGLIPFFWLVTYFRLTEKQI